MLRFWPAAEDQVQHVDQEYLGFNVHVFILPFLN